jgi:hypothetical protein
MGMIGICYGSDPGISPSGPRENIGREERLLVRCGRLRLPLSRDGRVGARPYRSLSLAYRGTEGAEVNNGIRPSTNVG